MTASLRASFFQQLAEMNQQEPASANPLLGGLDNFEWVQNTSLDHPDLLYSFVETLSFGSPASSSEVRLRYTEHYSEFFEALEKLAIVAALDLDLPGPVTVHRNSAGLPSVAGAAWAEQLLSSGGAYAEHLLDGKTVAIVVTGSIIRTEEGSSLAFKLELFALEEHAADGAMQIVEILK